MEWIQLGAGIRNILQKKIRLLAGENPDTWQFKILDIKLKDPRYKWRSFTITSYEFDQSKKKNTKKISRPC